MKSVLDWARGGALFGRRDNVRPKSWGGDNAPPHADLFPSALLELDSEGRVLWCNQFANDLFSQPLLGLKLSDFVHPQDQMLWKRYADCLPINGKGESETFRFICGSKALLWLQTSAKWQDGSAYLNLVDVGQKVRQGQSLQTTHRSLSNLIEGLPAMVYRCRNNPEFTMEYVNVGCFGLTGKTARELLDNSNYAALIHEDDRQQVWEAVQQALGAHTEFVLRFRLVGVDGITRRVLERGKGFYSESGEVLGIEGVVVLDQIESS